MIPPSQAPDADSDLTDDNENVEDDDDTGLAPAPLDVSTRQNLLFIEATTALFGSKKGTPDATEGLKKIEMWESIMQDSGKAGLGKIMQDFAVLREQLESPQPDAHVIALAVASLADETTKVAGATVDKRFEEPLAKLSEMLLKMGSSLSK